MKATTALVASHSPVSSEYFIPIRQTALATIKGEPEAHQPSKAIAISQNLQTLTFRPW